MDQHKKPNIDKRIMDVAHPGKSAPSASSKPVLVTNRPILKDPMMLDEDAKPEGEFTPKDVSRNVEVAPLEAPAAAPEEKPAADKTISQLAEEAEARATSEVAPEAPEVSSDAVSPAAESAADEEAKLDEAAKQEAALDKLVDSKQYFLPIDTVEKRRTKRFIILGIVLAVVLAIAWVDIALDAGIIQLGSTKALTHFFSN